MRDDTGFERQIGIVLDHMGGPEPTFDAMEIARTVVVPQRRPQTMVSAAKFLVAAAIVGLFAGFPLAAVLMQSGDEVVPAAASPSPTTTTDLLPGVDLVTEEVEPGVHRVIGDGAGHDLTPDGFWAWHIAAGPDGSVWLVDAGEGYSAGHRMFRLGQAGTVDGSSPHPYWPDLTVGPDGSVWGVGRAGTGWPRVGDGAQLVSLSDGTWTVHEPPEGFAVNGVEVTSDGTVLANGFEPGVSDRCGAQHSDDRGPPVVWRVADDGWRELPRLPEKVISAGDGGSLTVAPDGTAWMGVDFFNSCDAWGGLFRYDGRAWSGVPEVLGGEAVNVGPSALGSDGTLWVYATGERGSLVGERDPALREDERRLSRLVDGAWADLVGADGVPALQGSQVFDPATGVGLDGTLWIAFHGDSRGAFEHNQRLGVLDGAEDVGPCPGVLSFDGVTLRRHLAGLCANDLSVAPDGRVWVTVQAMPLPAQQHAGDTEVGSVRSGQALYVIDPSELGDGG